MVDALFYCICSLQVVWTSYFDRLFGQVILTGYFYRFDAWLLHLFIVHVEVQVDVWYMLA
jgi:hypothetical protein